MGWWHTPAHEARALKLYRSVNQLMNQKWKIVFFVCCGVFNACQIHSLSFMLFIAFMLQFCDSVCWWFGLAENALLCWYGNALQIPKREHTTMTTERVIYRSSFGPSTEFTNPFVAMRPDTRIFAVTHSKASAIIFIIVWMSIISRRMRVSEFERFLVTIELVNFKISHLKIAQYLN